MEIILGIIAIIIAISFWKHIIMGILGAAIFGFIGSLFGEDWLKVGLVFGFAAGIVEANNRKSTSASSPTSTTYTSAKENPNLTRFRRRYCSNCGQTSEHEIARISDGSSRAYVTCSSCGHWKEEAW